MATALSQITKTWTNPYNSKMSLSSAGFGGALLSGQYASTAGASGVYQVYGFIDPSAPAVQKGDPGVPVGLILNWRSIQQGGKPDPSWNYVSGMGGQLICNAAGDVVINVNHALIASNPLPPAVNDAGFYVDRLEYDAAQTQDSDATDQDAMQDPPADLATQGTVVYVDTQDPTTKLVMMEQPSAAAFWAAIELGGTDAILVGTCNTGYTSALGPYQSIAFCGISSATQAISLSGWLDHSTNTLTLQEYVVGPQPWDLRFFQARGRTITMKPQ